MPIIPDDKDWTWVLSHRCPDCGFDPNAVGFRDIPDLIRVNAAAWPALMAAADVAVRPDDSTWSTLEYAAHSRDVCRVMSTRLALLLDHDSPVFENWDQDATARAERYNDQDPDTVSAEYLDAAEHAATAFAAVDDSELERSGTRSNGSRFTVATLATYFLHDLVHHLWDVRLRTV